MFGPFRKANTAVSVPATLPEPKAPKLADLTDEQAAALDRDQYGDFELTDAVRPWPGRGFWPEEGYCRGNGQDVSDRWQVVMASVSRPRVFDVFLDTLGELTDLVEVALDVFDEHNRLRQWTAYCDPFVLRSLLVDHEHTLVDDGFVSLAAFDSELGREVLLDDHKLVIAYARDRGFNLAVEELWQSLGLMYRPALPLVTELPHVHRSPSKVTQREALIQAVQGLGV